MNTLQSSNTEDAEELKKKFEGFFPLPFIMKFFNQMKK